MSEADRDALRNIKTFPSLVKYLREELDWPIEGNNWESDLYFEYDAEELGIDPKTAAKITEIKQLRPLATGQPWGVFFIMFEPKSLPVVALRRILSQLVVKKRTAARKADQATWKLHDLLFISNYGDGEDRKITFAHFAQDESATDLPTLKVLGWDDADTALHIDHVHDELRNHLRWPDNEADLNGWRNGWSSAFTLRHREVITTSKQLAVQLADCATKIRKRVNSALQVETEKGPLRKLMAAFKEALIHDLSEDDFADTYAQTITYGLLTAAVSRTEPGEGTALVATDVKDMVPVTNPFLRDMLSTFLTVGGRKGTLDFDELGINDVVEVLRSPDTHMDAVLRDFGDRNPQEDPVVHFYELFLEEYDPKKRMQRGVFYTPRPVVSFIVRSVHEILQKEFGLPDGLADTTTWGEMVKKHKTLTIPKGAKPTDPFVVILDPATGTATFLVEVIDVIYKTMKAKWKAQRKTEMYDIPHLWSDYVADHLLPRLYGFELMMAPYAVAHMKVGLKLHETGYNFRSHERARIYLTNTLEEGKEFPDRLEFDAPALAHEAKAANIAKKWVPPTVMVGNPPYANFGMLNKNPWILALLDDYKRNLGEKKLTLDDDFIKFVRYAEWALARTGVGVLGFITNNTYLDGPTRRGMRHHLASTFPSIRIVDLHGNSIEREACPDGSPDENVFDIQQGVAVGVFVKPLVPATASGPVRHTHLYGLRDFKYGWLHTHTALSCEHTRVGLVPPLCLFQPLSGTHQLSSTDQEEYGVFCSLSDIFRLSGSGVKTDRDGLCFDSDRGTLARRMREAFSGEYDEDFRETYRIRDSSSYDLTRRLKTGQFREESILKCLYRPFDWLWLYYQPGFTSRPAWDVMQHMIRPNIGLLAKRQARDGDYDWFYVASGLVVDGSFSIDNKGREQIFPLYLYPETSRRGLVKGGDSREANFTPGFLGYFVGLLDDQPVAADVFEYIYAILHSVTYRSHYEPLLKTGFPRIPVPREARLFRLLASLGADIIAIHLLDDDNCRASWNISPAKTGSPMAIAMTKISGRGDDEVAAGHPKFSEGKIYIGGSRWFEVVPQAVWSFRIGGYQVCEKWLKDRRGQVLSKGDIEQYCKIVAAIQATIRLMGEIDKVIDAHGGWPGAFITDPKVLEGLKSKKA